jgi:hypothetical protein
MNVGWCYILSEVASTASALSLTSYKETGYIYIERGLEKIGKGELKKGRSIYV